MNKDTLKALKISRKMGITTLMQVEILVNIAISENPVSTGCLVNMGYTRTSVKSVLENGIRYGLIELVEQGKKVTKPKDFYRIKNIGLGLLKCITK